MLQFQLRELAAQIGAELIPACSDIAGALQKIFVRTVVSASQAAEAGALFVAIPGVKADGHDFIADAIMRGAAAAVVSSREKLGGYRGLLVSDTRAALSKLAAIIFGEPSKKLRVIGVTGTNGKTTIHWLLYHLLNAAGESALRLGTLGVKAEGLIDVESLTTPDALQLQEYLARAAAAGFKAAVLEASSHGLSQFRVADLAFDVGIFTNLTRDHLDYHGDFEQYFAAKRRLFELVAASGKPERAAVINCDCSYGRRLLAELPRWGLKDWSYGKSREAVVRLASFEQDFSGSRIKLACPDEELDIKVPLIGFHNAQNVAAVCAAALCCGYSGAAVRDFLAAAPPVPGRLEPVGNAQFGIYVDYAHTPDALENVLTALRPLARGKLWVLFGCGGDRDRGKRPEMAKISARLADGVVVTSDNPRTEDPKRVIDDILSSGIKPDLVEPDRRAAIGSAIERLRPGDVLLVAGKGHEDYQIIGAVKHHFSDQEEVRKVLGVRLG